MKVVVLGFDGMDPTLLDEMVEAGQLPMFERLRAESVSSSLKSTVIPMSPAAWSSFLTGTNPGKHGIYDFITRTGDGVDDFELVTAGHRQAPALWDYANANDIRVGIVGVPVTYPVEDLDRFMVSGFPTPRIDGSYVPDSLPYESPIPLEELHPAILYDGTNSGAFIEDQYRLWGAMESFHGHALTEFEWDVLVTVFKGTDDIAHVAWDKEPLYDAYRRADQVVDQTIEHLESLDEPYLLLVMSDHGFGPIEKTLFPNNILLDLGYASLRRSWGARIRRFLSGHHINLLTAYRLLARLGMAESLLSLSYEDSRLGSALERLRNYLFLGINDLAPDTACFSRGNFGQIYVEDGSVDIDGLRRDLLNYEVDGETIIDAVFLADEEFHGSMTARAPDVMIRTPEYRYIASRGFALATNQILSDHPLQRAADHKSTGVFFAYGSGVDLNLLVEEVALEDLLPSILAALDVPIPAMVDGEIIEGLGLRHPGMKNYDLSPGRDEGMDVDKAAIREQLESLGYMG